MPAPAIVALLTDFGLVDGYVGVMKGIILGIAPHAQLVDITHDIAPQDVATGAWILSTSWRAFPPGTIFLAVVDPGVGTARRPLAVSSGGYLFVGPDNGLFGLVLETSPVEHAVQLDRLDYFAMPEPSATFQGRDIFAPCAAHFAAGVQLEELGSPVDPRTLAMLPSSAPTWEGGMLIAHVLHVDRFGNLITSAGPELATLILAEPKSVVTAASRAVTARSSTFADGPVGEPFLLRDSSGYLAIAVRNSSAASLLGLGRGAEIIISGVRPKP